MYRCSLFIVNNPDTHYFGRSKHDLDPGIDPIANFYCDHVKKINTFEFQIRITKKITKPYNYATIEPMTDNDKTCLISKKRYFIIKDIEEISDRNYILTLRVDVLEENKESIMYLYGRIVRSYAAVGKSDGVPVRLDDVNTITRKKFRTYMYLRDNYGNDMIGDRLPFNKNTYHILVTAGKNGTDKTPAYKPGLCHMYAINGIGPIATVLYSENFGEILRNEYMDPQSFILDFFHLPIELKGKTRTGAYVFPVMGRYEMEGVDGYLLEKRYQEYWLGKFVYDENQLMPNDHVNRYFLRQPYTEFIIYLPFLGFKQLDMDLCGYNFSVFLNVDYLTGNFAYSIYRNGETIQKNSYPIYRWEGNMAQRIPICGTKQNINLTGLAAASASAATGIATGNIALAGSGLIAGAGAAIDSQTTQAQKIISSSSNGYWGEFSSYDPYILVKGPGNLLDKNFQLQTGSPFGYLDGRVGFVSDALVNDSGSFIMTDIANMNTAYGTDMSCTLDEFNEIKKLLGEGVTYGGTTRIPQA